MERNLITTNLKFMTKITKEDLQKKNWDLEKRVESLELTDNHVRKNISKFLGSTIQNLYSREAETKVLSWAEIYFELGKVMESKEKIIRVKELWQKIDEIQHRIEKINPPNLIK